MNDNIINKLENLVKQANDQKNKVCASTKVLSIIYVLLALFVIVYTTFLSVQIRRAVKNDSVSAIIKNIVTDQLNNIPAMIDDFVNTQAEPLADTAIAAIYDQLPTIESTAKNLIKEHSSTLVSQIKSDLFPQFHAIIRENANEIKLAAEALSDEEATKELAKILVKRIAEEIDYSHGLIVSEAQSKVDEINRHFVEILKKPESELTNKEASQRRLITRWLFLIDREQGLDKIFRTIINRTGYSWEYFMQELGIADAVKETFEGGIVEE
ncbi:MAG TPA: hypothetical protein P5105_03625 [Victivallales bacterium]|nr:hypothetical protein [Victivallales bacterium]HPO91276.1 hypothetical protein [Victivallales bacterium]HRR06351.1 hypothetical protein [Victivallales bacterium]HRR28705.1 hypothetical protein [Victivallales bacterium]HRU00927.1 hypothetical protein [Victivallales bacterium]